MSTHIQIGDIAPRIRYAADGATLAFTYPFPIFQDGDLEVYVDDTLQTLTTHYAVSGAGQSAGGGVTFVTAPTNGTTVTLVRRLAIQRTSDFQASGEFRAKVINDELDFQIAALQQVEDDQSRALRLSRFDDAANLELPAEASRASKVLAFDGNGDVALSNLTLTEMEAGASGPQGPSGPTGPAGNDGVDGLFSGAEASVTPTLSDLVALKDVSDSSAPKFATVQDILASADDLPDLGAAVDTAADKILVIDASDGNTPKTVTPEDIAPAGGAFESALLHVQDRKASGTAGGTFTSGARRTRDLNTTLTNEIAGASVSAHQVTLPAGTYFVEAWGNAYACGSHQTSIYNVTDSVYLLYGSAEFLSSGHQNRSAVSGRFTLAASKTIELGHECATTKSTDGFGSTANFGEPNVHSEIKIWKVA